MYIETKERGWAGHFCKSSDCLYHRNTSVTNGDVTVIISTVGNYYPNNANVLDDLGGGRIYETMVFLGKEQFNYIEADVENEVVNDVGQWFLTRNELRQDSDNQADEMHDRIVNAVTGFILTQTIRVFEN
jgi:hypothetical protein